MILEKVFTLFTFGFYPLNSFAYVVNGLSWNVHKCTLVCTKGDHLVRGSKNCLSEYVWVEVLDTPVQKNADMHSYAE